MEINNLTRIQAASHIELYNISTNSQRAVTSYNGLTDSFVDDKYHMIATVFAA
jgi:hypothetical protein